MRSIITAFMAIIVFTAAILCGCSVSEAEKRFSEGTSINGVDVSGMNRAEAKEKLDGELKAQLSEIEYSINTGDETVKLKAEELGIATPELLSSIREDQKTITNEMARLQTQRQGGVSLAVRISQVAAYRDLPNAIQGLSADLVREIELGVRYQGYIQIEKRSAQQMRRQEAMKIPEGLDFMSIGALRFESREKLSRVRPENLGQAARIPGVTPADIAVLSVFLTRLKRTEKSLS